MQIAIDGPAAVGKTTVGRALAHHFGCLFVETGRMYRGVALGLSRGRALEELSLSVTEDGRLLLNGEDVTPLLYTPELDRLASEVATRPEVRERLVALQRQVAHGRSVVMEGRDIGTVVLPHADVKLFLEASPEERARRRAGERGEPGVSETLAEIRTRDDRDRTRRVAPLNPAPDATTIVTDARTLAEVISQAIALVEAWLEGRGCGG